MKAVRDAGHVGASCSAATRARRAAVLRAEPGAVQALQVAGASRPSTSSSTTTPKSAPALMDAARMAERSYARLSRILGPPVPREEADHPLRLARRLRAEQRHRRPRRRRRRCHRIVAPPPDPAVHRRLRQLRARARARDGARVPVRHLRPRQGRRESADAGAGRSAALVHGRNGGVSLDRPGAPADRGVDARRGGQRQPADDRADDGAARQVLPVSLRRVALAVRRRALGRRGDRRDPPEFARPSASSARSSASSA